MVDGARPPSVARQPKGWPNAMLLPRKKRVARKMKENPSTRRQRRHGTADTERAIAVWRNASVHSYEVVTMPRRRVAQWKAGWEAVFNVAGMRKGGAARKMWRVYAALRARSVPASVVQARIEGCSKLLHEPQPVTLGVGSAACPAT